MSKKPSKILRNSIEFSRNYYILNSNNNFNEIDKLINFYLNLILIKKDI